MSTDLIIIEITNPLQVFGTPKGLDAIIDKIEADVKTIDRDISTEAGRDNIRSVAFKLAKSKKEIERMGLALTEQWREQTALVNAEKKRAGQRMQDLQDEIRKPLTEWEDAEKARVQRHEDSIGVLASLATWEGIDIITAKDVQGRIDAIPRHFTRRWEEFEGRAKSEREKVLIILTAQHAALVKAEADAAELARLKAEEAARLQAERDAKIAADAKAEAERLADERARAEAGRVQAEADELACKVERDRLAAVAREEKLAADLKQAEADKVAAAELATKKERERADAEVEKQLKASKAREADRDHRAKVNNTAAAALVLKIEEHAAGNVEALVKIIITAIAKGEIPHVSISY